MYITTFADTNLIFLNKISTYFTSLSHNWIDVLKDKNFRTQFFFTMLSYIFLFKYCRIVMAIFENRKGIQIHDKFLALLPSIDASNLIFILTYTVLVIFIITTIVNPKHFLKAMQAYCLLMIMRTICIYLVPLEPPIGMIILKDTISNYFMSGHCGKYIVKDLFFSGHVSTAVLFCILTENKKIKKILITLTIIIAILILLQHVHYLIDVVAAPFFSFLAYSIILFAHRKNPIHIFLSKRNINNR